MYDERRIKHNRCRCHICATIIGRCRAIFTDGGREYIRRGGDFFQIENLTEYYD